MSTKELPILQLTAYKDGLKTDIYEGRFNNVILFKHQNNLFDWGAESIKIVRVEKEWNKKSE